MSDKKVNSEPACIQRICVCLACLNAVCANACLRVLKCPLPCATAVHTSRQRVLCIYAHSNLLALSWPQALIACSDLLFPVPVRAAADRGRARADQPARRVPVPLVVGNDLRQVGVAGLSICLLSAT